MTCMAALETREKDLCAGIHLVKLRFEYWTILYYDLSPVGFFRLNSFGIANRFCTRSTWLINDMPGAS